MKYSENPLSLIQWIHLYKEDWELICGVSSQEMTQEDAWRIFPTLLELARTDPQFDAICTVFITRYYDSLFPNASEYR